MELRDWLVPRPRAAAGGEAARVFIAPGLYHYLRDAGGTPVRFHLRVDPDGCGLLVANAAAAARLRPSGVVIAKAVLEGRQDSEITMELVRVFRGVTAEMAAGDVREVRGLIARLETPADNYPILNLADPAFAPRRAPLARPLSADVPMAEPERLVPLVDRLWQLAIPHATFIAGRACDPRWIARAVERTEDLGMIAGVRIGATDLVRGTLLADLATAGVDHVDVRCLSHEAAAHDAIVGVGDHANMHRAMVELREREVCAVAEIALVGANLASIDETIQWLADRDVTNAAVFAVAAAGQEASGGAVPAEALVPAATMVEEAAETHGLRLLWYPPVRHDPSVELADQVCRGPRSSGDTAIRVEPDGTVIPARGPRQRAGNLMTDDWETIRGRPMYQAYCRLIEADTRCETCPGLAICAAACPRDPAGWADEREGAR